MPVSSLQTFRLGRTHLAPRGGSPAQRDQETDIFPNGLECWLAERPKTQGRRRSAGFLDAGCPNSSENGRRRSCQDATPLVGRPILWRQVPAKSWKRTIRAIAAVWQYEQKSIQERAV